MSADPLDELLSAALGETADSSKLHTSFGEALNGIDSADDKESNSNLEKLLSNIHTGDTDSSDDEDRRDFENRKYNESGRDIKRLLEVAKPTTSSDVPKFNKGTSWAAKQLQAPNNGNKPKIQTSDAMFGIRVINPLISSAVVEDRMVGREVVMFSTIKMFVRNVPAEKDWVIAGVIVSKTPIKTSKNDKKYFSMTLSDLKVALKTVTVLMFSSACKELWKVNVGTVVGILNPTVLDLRDGSKDEACLSVYNQQRVMILGQSKDFGICKSFRKNGERCTAFVNTSTCEFCVYHVKQEYQKCSQRADLQSGFGGGGLTALRNKVLGKDQVFYAGKLYTAIPASKNKKQVAKDQRLLSGLSGFTMTSRSPVRSNKQKQAARLELSARERRRDLERLRQLGVNADVNFNGPAVKFNAGLSRGVSVEDSKNLALDVISKLKENKSNKETNGGANKNVKFSKVEDLKSAPLDVGNKLRNEGSKTSETEIASKSYTNKETKRLEYDRSEETLEGDLNSDGAKSSECCKSQKVQKDGMQDICDVINLDVDFKQLTKNQKGFLGKNDAKLSHKVSDLKSPTSNSSSEKVIKRLEYGRTSEVKLDDDLNSDGAKSSDCDVSQKVQKSRLHQNSLIQPKLNAFTNVPFLSRSKNAVVDLNSPIQNKHTARAKRNALAWVQNNGPIEKQDPNNTRGTAKGKKRALETLNDSNDLAPDPKQAKIQENEFFSERFKKMMAMTSKHVNLLEQRDNEEQEKYFHKLEIKEQMEEKMLSTYKMACKAVKCLTCKYTSFSAADLCKTERHPLKVFDAVKRFFKCGNCGNRTVSLSIIPTVPCKNCGSGKWEKTSMMKEKRVELAVPKLSIRGGEQKFVNSVVADANLDLMVPDS